VVSRWLPTVSARVWALVRSCVISGRRSGSGEGFLWVLWFPLWILIPSSAPLGSSTTWTSSPNSPLTCDTSLDKTTWSPKHTPVSNPWRWPRHRTATTSFGHFWRQTRPSGSRNISFPAPQSPSTATHLPGNLGHSSPLPYSSKYPSQSTICHAQALNPQRNWSRNVSHGLAFRRIVTPGHELAIIRHHRTSTAIRRLHLLPHCNRPLHALARSHPHRRHHSRNRGTCPLDRLDIPFWLPANHHHRPRTSVWVTVLPLPGQALRYSPISDNRLSSRGQRTRGTLPPDAKGSHHVPRRPAVDGGASFGSRRHQHLIQRGPAGFRSWARVRRTLTHPRWVPNSYHRPRGTCAHHPAAPPSHGPPQTSSGSTPHPPSHIRAQGPPLLHLCHVFLRQDATRRAL
jgi:hypothetical protein